jgi:predicted transcriptional regulator
MHSIASPTRCQAAARRVEALKLRSAGKTYREIAAELGCSVRTAYRAVTCELEQVRARLSEDAAQYLQLELSRLDHLLTSVWKEAG